MSSNSEQLPPEIINHIISFSRNRLPPKLLSQIEMFHKPIEYIFENIYQQFPFIEEIFYYVHLSHDLCNFFMANNDIFCNIYDRLSEKEKKMFQYSEERFFMYMNNYGFLQTEYWTPKRHIFKVWKYLKNHHICLFIDYLRLKYNL